jgi:hypothetical protein
VVAEWVLAHREVAEEEYLGVGLVNAYNQSQFTWSVFLIELAEMESEIVDPPVVGGVELIFGNVKREIAGQEMVDLLHVDFHQS